MKAGEIPWQLVGPETPGGRYLRHFWHPVFRSCDLVSGRAERIGLLGEKLTLFRGETGRAFVLQDRCPHRGTLLAVGTVEGDDLRCHHHGWRFAGDGRCLESPGRELGSNRAACARAYPAEEYLGLIFVWLGESPAPELPGYPDYEQPGILRVTPPELWPCSFFQRLENSCDIAHVRWAHRTSGVASVLNGKLELEIDESVDGLEISATIDGHQFPAVRFSLPNVLEFSTPISAEVGWRNHLVWRVPTHDDACVSFSVALVPANVPGAERYRLDQAIARPLGQSRIAELGEAVLSGRMRLTEIESSSLTEIEDYVALVGQGCAAERGSELLSSLDAPVIALRRKWLSEVEAAESRA